MKTLFFSLLFALPAAPVFSQFYLGFSGGMNQSFWTWKIKSIDVDLDYESALAWRGVVFGEWQSSPVWRFRAEMGAQVKANQLSHLQFSDMISTGHLRTAYQYWEGSLLAQFSPIRKYAHAYLLAGGTVGRLDKAWQWISRTEGGKSFKEKISLDLADPYWNRNAFAADFGFGGNIPLGANSRIKLELRYQYGLSRLSKNSNVDTGVNTLLYTLGYMHRL